MLYSKKKDYVSVYENEKQTESPQSNLRVLGQPLPGRRHPAGDPLADAGAHPSAPGDRELMETTALGQGDRPRTEAVAGVIPRHCLQVTWSDGRTPSLQSPGHRLRSGPLEKEGNAAHLSVALDGPRAPLSPPHRCLVPKCL